MSPQEVRGDKQPTGRRPASGQPTRSGSPGQRAKTQSGQGRGPQGAPPRGGKGQSGRGPTGRPVNAGPPSGRFTPSTLAFGTIVLVVVVVVALVLVKVLGGSSSPGGAGQGPVDTPAQASVVSEVTSVSQSEAAQVGVPSGLNAPQVAKNQSVLTKGGLPWAFFIGGEFCPYCAAERWAIVMTMSRFGSFSGLQETTSSPYDTDPATATFSFYGSTYTSSVLKFEGLEHVSNDTTAIGTRTNKVALTSQESSLWSQWSTHFGTTEGFPFMDIGNQVFVMAPSYNPAVLAGLDQSAIAAKLSNPNDPVTQAIVGTANYLTAAVCHMLGSSASGNPWCSAGGTTAAAKALGLS